jgi:ATP-binding cassette subfamily F protein 3
MKRPLLEVNNLSKQYGKQVVIDDLSFVISEGQKIGFIGRNGAGKSTLLNILTNKEEADAGDVQFMPIARVGVINQHETLPGDTTTLEFLQTESGKELWEIKKLSARFGLHDEYLNLAPTALSGGYQMRVKIVKMLLHDPNLLLLDEPVNYLDLSTLLLLEDFLKTYKGAFLLIAHDREFLQNVCTETFEIERGKLTSHKGKVTDYLAWKQEQLEFAQKTNKKLKREIAHHQEFVDRFRYKASLATRAQSKIKHIAKLRGKIAAIDANLATTRIAIPCPRTPGGRALAIDKLTIGYPNNTIATGIDFDLQRGEKILVAGNNGTGKSTFLKTLVGDLEPLGGEFRWWKGAMIGYFDQLTERTLKPSETVLQYLTRMAPINTSGEGILMMAGNFLFKGDDLDKPTRVLSGGERARLCLAGVLLHENNVLILDEPSNHLDVETTEALALALKRYGGTVIFVSHARTFVSALVDRILEVRDGKLRQFAGNYEDYVQDLKTLEELDHSDSSPYQGEAGRGCHEDKQQRKELQRELRQVKREITKIEKQIAKLSENKSELLLYFFEHPTDYAPEKHTKLKEITKELEKIEEKWLSWLENAETLEKRIKRA